MSPTDRPPPAIVTNGTASAPATPGPIVWADPTREAAFQGWLTRVAADHQLDTGSLRLAAADAGFRRYFRLDSVHGSRIVMDAPPDKENCEPFVRIAALMAKAGLRVPEVLAWDEAAGFMLLSDLGAQTMLDVLQCDTPQDPTPLFHQAIDALITLQLASQPGVLPVYDAAVLQRELALFPDWYIARHLGLSLDARQEKALREVFEKILANNLAQPQVYVHRDYHSRNLMVSGDDYPANPGILDFQDAVYGPITYDLVSLYRDAYIQWEEEQELDCVIRYWERARQAGLAVHADFHDFYRDYEWMGAQRQIKVLGIFARLCYRDGKDAYLNDMPRVMAYLRRTCERYIELKPLVRLLDQVENRPLETGLTF